MMTEPIQPQRFISLKDFAVGMLGYKSDVSYYNHMHDPGWPQRVWVAGRPMLVYEECLAFQQRLIEARIPVDERKPGPGRRPPQRRKAETPPPKRRRTGRPVKAHPSA